MNRERRSLGNQTPKNFLFHHGTLIRVYKAKLADELRAAALYDQVPADVWNKDFVVDIQPVGHGVPTLKYLAPYVHRVAISDKRIVAVDESSVTLHRHDRPSPSGRSLARFLASSSSQSFAQHILPRRLSEDPSLRLDEFELEDQPRRSEMAGVAVSGLDVLAGQRSCTAAKPLTAPLRCAECGGEMRVVAVTYEAVVSLSDRASRLLRQRISES